MVNPEAISLSVGVSGLGLVALASIPAFQRVVRRLFLFKRCDYQALQEHYEDKDGVATGVSVNAFSDTIQRVTIACCTVIGFLVSLALALITTPRRDQALRITQWLQLAIWIFIALQALCLFIEPSPRRRFTLGLYSAISSILFISAVCVQAALPKSKERWSASDTATTVLASIQVTTAFVYGCTSLLLPRRPDVFRNGKPVDRQYTVSFISRVSFNWADPLLRFTTKNKGLDINDLPELDHHTRSRFLLESFETTRKSKRLWKALIRMYVYPLTLEVILVCISSVLSFSPQLCLLGILRTLEARQNGLWEPLKAWAWVLSLGASMLLHSTIESWLFWIVYSKLGIVVYEQLSALVFAKSMRRKDVKGVEKSAEIEKYDTQVDKSGSTGGQRNDEEDEESVRKTRQATINLVAVDSKRVSDFAAFNFIVASTIIKLSVAFTFLIRLIGWKSLCSGLLVSVIITPVNIFAAQRYTGAQTSLMKFRDQKMAMVTEVLQGIRQIKFSALEDQWEQKIRQIRNTELQAQWTAFLYDMALISIWILGPVMLSAVSLGVYSLIYGELSASVAFTTMTVFASIELTLAILPELIADFIEAWISAGRIEKYLDSAEKVNCTVPADEISFEKATIAWPVDDDEDAQERFVLRNVSFNLPPKALTVISGKTGSGKSLLLASILGETEILEGVIRVPVPPPLEERFDDHATKVNWIIDSAIAFVAQVPWIENASIRDNILFGLPFDSERYQKVLFACALEKDLDMLPDGELTDIGANGINLSGGQKWRVSFARALYSRAGILVMDDLFSALDAHTGRHLHEHALTGELGQGRTRILVTHHVALCLPQTDYSIHLEDGTVAHTGSVEALKRSGILAAIMTHAGNHEAGTPDTIEGELSVAMGESNSPHNALPHRPQSRAALDSNGSPSPVTPQKFQQDERRETGAIKFAHYRKYFQNGGGGLFWICVLLAFMLYAAFAVGRSYWVTLWTRSTAASSSPEQALSMMAHVTKGIGTAMSNGTLWFYLGIYVGMSVLTCVIGSLRYGLMLIASIRASRNLFDKLTYAVLRAPLRWLDTVPVGRILNRFTADFNMIDSKLAYDFGFMLYNVLQVLGIVVAGLLVSPILIVFAITLLLICFYYSQLFLAGAREIKRLESNAKSPVFEQFGSALIGLGTIRAFGKAQTYVERMYGQIDRHAQAYWNLWLFNRWLGFRMNIVGAVFSTITAALIVYTKGIDASLAGFALSFALQYTNAITWALRQYTNVELDMNATERVLEYADIAIENQGGVDVPAAWPTQGRLEVCGLVVGYAPELPAVLQGLSFSVDANQRVGVVGRTGAGKSSLTLALFRFLEAREGQIHIDGVDVSKIKLHDLRSRLAIIPQDPVLFSGTIRSNLDPFNEYTDGELRDALERVHLVASILDDGTESHRSSASTANPPQSAIGIGTITPTVISTDATTTSSTETPTATHDTDSTNINTNMFDSLNSVVSEGGLNLSQGQRQLLCLARAIVSRPKIMVLDEATSAVDMATDALIQRSIRSEFGRNSTTLLVIAHRISTIADFDRILVMDAGKAVEFGSPRDLMGIEGGVFRSLVEESGEREKLKEIILGAH